MRSDDRVTAIHRFFVPPDAVSERVRFDAAQAHQMRNVLRLRPGARVIALDGSGWEFVVELRVLRREEAVGVVCERRLNRAEPRVHLTLYQSLLKRERMEWVLQKGTELGVAAFVPVVSERCVATGVERVAGKRPRWERIIREAAEQSGRGRLPRLACPLTFDAACRESICTSEIALMPWVEAAEAGIGDELPGEVTSLALLIGPEGGFAEGEVALAREAGVRLVSLGPRVLRAETAALAAVAVSLAALGEMQPRDRRGDRGYGSFRTGS